MKTQKIIKNQTAVSIDLHLKYRCPNSECSNVHWVSLGEAKTKNFKVVCYCGTVFSPKVVKKVKLQYGQKKKPSRKIENSNTEIVQKQETQPKKQIPKDVLEKAASILIQYGFTKTESQELIVETFNQHDIIDTTELVKLALKTFGENQHGK